MSGEQQFEFIMAIRGEIVDRDLLGQDAAHELIEGAVRGLVKDEVLVTINVQQIWDQIFKGQTVRLDNEASGTSFVFQIPRREKKRNH